MNETNVDTLIVMLYYGLFLTFEISDHPYSLILQLKPKLNWIFTVFYEL